MFHSQDWLHPRQVLPIFQILNSLQTMPSLFFFLQLIKGKSRDLQKILKYFNGQQLLHLICYYYLVCAVLILSYTEKIYLLLFCCYLFHNYLHHYFHQQNHLLHLYNNSTNFLMPQNNYYYITITITIILHGHKNITIFFMFYECVINFLYFLSGALFLKVSFLLHLLAVLVPVTLIVPFTTVYTSP